MYHFVYNADYYRRSEIGMLGEIRKIIILTFCFIQIFKNIVLNKKCKKNFHWDLDSRDRFII